MEDYKTMYLHHVQPRVGRRERTGSNELRTGKGAFDACTAGG